MSQQNTTNKAAEFGPTKYYKQANTIDHNDSRYIYLEEKYNFSSRDFEKSRWYSTNQSNQKYVPYYILRTTIFKFLEPTNQPVHPRKRHRCDYHITDMMTSSKDGKASTWGCLIQVIKCLQSDPGNEPERLRDEYWMA